ncbi:MAG: MazG nucleotide pyrophosphohydrolase domain-containing protein [Brevinema sp.]
MKSFHKLLDIIKTLRSENGCPWDKVQTLNTLDSLFLEECYELSYAIHENNIKEIREELGDTFFMLLLMAYITEQNNICTIDDIFNDASTKLIFRHPHVFGDIKISSKEEVMVNWEKLKKQEKQDRTNIFDGIPASLPDMMRFSKLMRKLKNHNQDISEYKENSDSPKALLKNLLIEYTNQHIDLVAILKEINRDIEYEAKDRGL